MYPQLHEHNLTISSPVYDYDDDYDLYYFFPSIAPHTLIRARAVVQTRRAFDGQPQMSTTDANTSLSHDYVEEFDSPPPYAPPLSTAYFFESDYAFPDTEVHERLRNAGYSRLLRVGLASTPRHITRHLDALLSRLKRRLLKLKTRLLCI